MKLFFASLSFIAVAHASAEPYVFMYTSSGTLLRAELGSNEYEVVGLGIPEGFRTNNITTLETAPNGQLFASFGLGNTLAETGIIARVNRATGVTTPLYSLGDNPDFGEPNKDFQFGSGMAVDNAGEFWTLNWHFASQGKVYLHKFDVETGNISQKILTNLGPELSGAMAFRDDGMLATVAFSRYNTLSILDPSTGSTLEQVILSGVRESITGMTRYENQAYLSTQYGLVYHINLDTFDTTLVSNYYIINNYGTLWGLTINPTPGASIAFATGLLLATRRRRQC